MCAYGCFDILKCVEGNKDCVFSFDYSVNTLNFEMKRCTMLLLVLSFRRRSLIELIKVK
jgi:hypothetical protein